jgi:hypothetical protein
MVAAAKAVAADRAKVTFFIFIISTPLVDLRNYATGPSGSALLECPRTQDPKPDYLSETADFAGLIFPRLRV